jgi:hypothetical protein
MHTTFKMKTLYIALLVLAILSHVVKVYDFDMLNIMMSIQFAERGVFRSQQSTEFIVPLYSDCDYISLAELVKAGKLYYVTE